MLETELIAQQYRWLACKQCGIQVGGVTGKVEPYAFGRGVELIVL